MGRPARARRIALVPDRTAEILRVEAGRPRLGKDADDTHMPEEVGLSSAISATKGCYVGQEVVARHGTYGRVNHRLVGFRIPSPPVPEGTAFPDPRKPDHELARITSVVVSPRFGTIGLGLAFRRLRDGDSLAIGGCRSNPVVSPLPFA